MKTQAAQKTGLKFLWWAVFGGALTALLTNIGALPLPADYEWIRPIIAAILGAIGKSIATYVATPED